MLEKHKVEVLINDTQSTSDATNTLTGIAYKSDVPVLDVSEQMPSRLHQPDIVDPRSYPVVDRYVR